jgi:hypothetical protein
MRGLVSRRGGAAAVLAAVASGATGLIVAVGSAGSPAASSVQCLGHPVTTSEGSPSARAPSMLAVLRRRQTAADTPPSTPFPELPRFGGEGILIHYIRLARVVSGTSYYVMPVAKGCRSSTEEVLLNARSPQGSGFGGATLAQIQQGRDLGSQGLGASSVVSGIVPDGVAKVTLTYSPRGPNRSTRLSNEASRSRRYP